MRSFWSACFVIGAACGVLAACSDFATPTGRSRRYGDPSPDDPDPEEMPRDGGMTKAPPAPSMPRPGGPAPAPTPPPEPTPTNPPPAPTPTPDAGSTPPPAPPPPPPPADAGMTPGLPPPAPTVTPFPSGPYGFRRGDTIDDLEFTRQDGSTLTMAQIRSDPSVKAIVWSSGAMWCGACRAETGELQDAHSRIGARGVFIMQSMFENEDGSPADARTAQTLARESGADFEILAESPPHYSGGAIPTIWVIDAETMEVVSFEIGGDPGLEDTALSVVRSSRR